MSEGHDRIHAACIWLADFHQSRDDRIHWPWLGTIHRQYMRERSVHIERHQFVIALQRQGFEVCDIERGETARVGITREVRDQPKWEIKRTRASYR